MIEMVIPIALGIASSGLVLVNRIHNRIDVLDKRIDQLELRICERLTKLETQRDVNCVK